MGGLYFFLQSIVYYWLGLDMIYLCIEINSQYLLEGVLMQSPSDSALVKGHQIAEEGSFIGGSDG